jgi:ABC-type transport system substrate-binding protein
MLKNKRRAASLAVVALFAALLPADPAGAATAAAQQADGEVSLMATSCRQISNFDPWTYLSGSCMRNDADATAYSAELTCWDVSAGVSYPAFGRVYNTPLFSYGPTSTARCDPGDYATSGEIAVYGDD